MPDQELATQEKQELAPVAIAPPIIMEGEESEDLVIPVCHIFHDAGNEAKERGNHVKGTVLHSLTHEEIAMAVSPFKAHDLPPFLPLMFKGQYVAWEDERGNPPLYVCDSKAEVIASHPEDLEWGSGKDGVGPRAQRVMNFIGIFEGHTEPMVIPFTKSATKTGRALYTIMKANRTKLQTYVISITEKSGDKGAWYIFGRIRPAGPPREDLADMANVWRPMLGSAEIAVEGMQQDGEDTPF